MQPQINGRLDWRIISRGRPRTARDSAVSIPAGQVAHRIQRAQVTGQADLAHSLAAVKQMAGVAQRVASQVVRIPDAIRVGNQVIECPLDTLIPVRAVAPLTAAAPLQDSNRLNDIIRHTASLRSL
jgi:hypothetical protein